MGFVETEIGLSSCKDDILLYEMPSRCNNMRSRLSSGKRTSLLTKEEGRNSSITNLDPPIAVRRSLRTNQPSKAKKTTRRILNCELPMTPREHRRPMPIHFSSEDTEALSIDETEQDSVLLELVDLLSFEPVKRIKQRQPIGVAESESTLKKSVRALARVRPLKLRSLISPTMKGSARTSRN